MSEIKLSLENIGGITTQRSFTLKPGINMVKAPNAVGKSSLVHGLQTMILPESTFRTEYGLIMDYIWTKSVLNME